MPVGPVQRRGVRDHVPDDTGPESGVGRNLTGGLVARRSC